MDTQLFRTTCWKASPFPTEIWYFDQNSTDHLCLDYFQTPTLFHWSTGLSSHQDYTTLIPAVSQQGLKSSGSSPSALLFLYKMLRPF